MNEPTDDRSKSLQALVAEKSYHKSLYTQTVVASSSATGHVVDTYLDIYFEKYAPLNRTAFWMLQILISEGGRLNQTELGKRVFRSRYTITKTVDTLEEQGWVERQPVKGDRRARNVVISEKGLNLVRESMDGMYEMSQKILACLSDEEQKQLREINRKLRMHLTDLVGNADGGE